MPHRALQAHIAPPDGFTRVPTPERSFGAFLRELPVRTDRTWVQSFRGNRLDSPSAAVILLDVGDRDLQQCADAAIRLHAEYLWSQGAADRAAYHFTSGDLTEWTRWKGGERFAIAGSKVARSQGAPRPDDHKTYRGWLDLVFTYAGSRSLARDADPVPYDRVQPGDVYVQGGSPGHAVLVLDLATHPDGRRAALIGQSYMPAQDFHVVRSSGPRVVDDVWFLLPDPDHPTVHTPSWAPFRYDEAYRFSASAD